MKGFFAVVRREIIERRDVFAAAAILAVLPFFVPLLPAVRRYGAPEARLYTAAFLATAFAAALSLLLGTTSIGRDLSQGRLGFYFARPISGGAIWMGKLAGAWLTTVSAALVTLLPVGLFDRSTWWRESQSSGLVGNAAATLGFAVVVFLAAGNVASLALRSRSVWVAGDLICLVVWALAVSAISMPLVFALAPVATRNFGLAVALACSAALLSAGGAQVVFGRVDLSRGNKARFVALWSLLFVLAACCLVSVRWLLSPEPGDLISAWVGAAPARGTWIEVEGRARHRADLETALFYDVSSGRFVRARTTRQGAVTLSRDGTTAAWTQAGLLNHQGRQDVWVCRLAAGETAGTRTPISTRLWDIQLSPDGSRIAVIEEQTLAVYEVPSGQFLASVALQTEQRTLRIAFLTNDRLRVYRIGPIEPSGATPEQPSDSIEVLDLDVRARKLQRVSSITRLPRPFALTFDDRDGRVIVWEKAASIALFDLASGRLVAVLGQGNWGSVSRGFLSDGRPILAEARDGNGRVHMFSEDGRRERVFDVGPAGTVQLGAEPSSGKVALGISATPAARGTTDAYLLDLTSGALRKLGARLSPVAARMRWRLPAPDPGSEITRLLERSDGSLIRLDPATGALTALFSAR